MIGRLRQVFKDSCHKNGITDSTTIEDITKAGFGLFAINQAGYVESRGNFENISVFVKSFKAREQRQGVPKKQQLYGKLVEMAEKGDMRGFRRVRKEYSAA